jgi:ferritin-like protein
MHKISEIVAELKVSYAAEIEVIEIYLAQASNLEGPRAEPIKEWLDLEVETGLSHARRLARRINALEGKVPASPKLSKLQKESAAGATDVDSVLLGAIKTADTAITQYEKIIELCDGHDFVTLDLVIELLVDERERKQQLMGFANSR